MGNFEFGVRNSSNNEFVPKGQIGMGRSSTFIKALADANRTSSNTWSLFWGTEVTKTPRDGSLIIGGYDKSLIGNARNVTIPFDRTNGDCKEGMVVDISGMSLNTEARSEDIMQGLGKQTVCIVPSVSNLLTLPSRYWDRMQSIMGVELYSSFRNGTAETYHYNTTIVTAESAYVVK